MTESLKGFASPGRQYLIITISYWLFTINDGALRMLIVLHFHNLGYSTLQIAFLFLFYEAFGVVTNLIGGYLGARFGVNRVMNYGLVLQIGALAMLLVPEVSLTVVWVMCAQAMSGVSKDLNKMSAKSAIKFLLPDDAQGRLYLWVARLTGSKNALKGFGFFLGAVLLSTYSFRLAIIVLLGLILVAVTLNIILLTGDLGRSITKPKFNQLLSRSRAINLLSTARVFLFASRDAWFVVGLPVYFATEMGFSHWQTGSFMAVWIIVYGIVQAFAPQITRTRETGANSKLSMQWVIALFITTILVTTGFSMHWPAVYTLLPGLFIFGVIFAVNSSIHSYLIVSYANRDNASIDVGFYYMANAAGRLTGTLLSGYLYLTGGLLACLIGSCSLLLLATIASTCLYLHNRQ